jgi:hypothetical protein
VLTLVVFASGVLLGARDGALVGALTTLIYSMLNLYGMAHPLVTGSQVLGEMMAGTAGGLLAGMARWPLPLRATTLAVTGALITAAYDLLTNLASGVVYGQMRATLIGGIPFALWHIGTNAALFAVIGTPVVAVFARYRSRFSQPA